MTQTRFLTLPSSQQWLIEPMQKMGYLAESAGICYGVSHMGMQAILNRDLETFNRRLWLIANIPDLSTQIALAITKWKKIIEDTKKQILTQSLLQQKLLELKDTQLSQEERDLLDIAPFYDGVEIVQVPDYHQDFFTKENAPKGQNPILTVPFIESKESNEKGGNYLIGFNYGVIYDEAEMTTFLQTLRAAIEQSGIQYPIALILNSINHAIAVGYDPQIKSWMFINANHLPVKYFSQENELAKALLSGFFCDRYAGISTTLYAAGQNKKEASTMMENWMTQPGWQDMHTITAESCKRVDSLGCSLLFRTTAYGDLPATLAALQLGADPNQGFEGSTNLINFLHSEAAVSALLSAGADPNQANKNGETPLYLACKKLYFWSVKALLEKNANPNTVNPKNDQTPLHCIAMGNKNTLLLQLVMSANLLLDGAEPNPLDMVERTPLSYAASQGNASLVSFLLTKNAQVNTADIDGKTPLHYAVENGDLDTVTALLKHHADVTQTDVAGHTPIDIARLKGNDAVLSLLQSSLQPALQSSLQSPLPLSKRENLAAKDATQPPHHAARRLAKSQGWLIDAMKSVGYSTHSDEINYGVAAMGMQAWLTQDINTFNKRLELIADTPHLKETLNELTDKQTKLIQWMKQAPQENISHECLQQKISEETKLMFTQEELALLDVKPFFENLYLYEKAHQLSYLFEKGLQPTNYDVELTSRLTLPLALQKEEKIEKVDQFAGLYTREEMVTYCQTLRDLCDTQTPPLKHPVAWMLQNGLNILTVGYDPTKKSWFLLNPKQLPGKCFSKHEEVAEQVFKYFATADYAQFSSHAFAPPSQSAEIKQLMQNFRHQPAFSTMHQVTDAKANLSNSAFGSWLMLAAKYGDSKTVKELLDAGANPNALREGGVSALILAINFGHLDVIEELVKRGADVQQTTKTGGTPLYLAAVNGNIEAVKILLDHQADINKVTTNHLTPLHVAAAYGHTALVKFMLEHQADINRDSQDGGTPLFCAIEGKHTETLKELLDKGADVNVTYLKYSPLTLATSLGHADAVNELLNKCDPNQFDQHDQTPLHVAIEKGNLPMVRALLDKGANVHLFNKDNMSPLFVAVEKKRMDIIEELINRKINLNQMNPEGMTPLHIAAEKGDINMLKLLLNQGLDVNAAMSPHQATSLHIAIQFGLTEVANMLLQNKANPNASFNADVNVLAHFASAAGRESPFKQPLTFIKGFTPLHLATFLGRSDLVQALIHAGADVQQTTQNDTTRNGMNALQLAQTMHYPDIEKMIREELNKEEVNKCVNQPSELRQQLPQQKAVHSMLPWSIFNPIAGSKYRKYGSHGTTPHAHRDEHMPAKEGMKMQHR